MANARIEIEKETAATIDAFMAKEGFTTRKRAAEELIEMGWTFYVARRTAYPVAELIKESMEAVAAADRRYREDEAQDLIDRMDGLIEEQRRLVAAMAYLAKGK